MTDEKNAKSAADNQSNHIRGTGAEHQRQIELLNALLGADLDEKLRLVETYADWLLHPDAEAMLRANVEPARMDGSEGAANIFATHADLLANCRSRGAAVVFAEIRLNRSGSEIASSPRQDKGQLTDLLNAFLAADVDEQKQLIESRADLLLHGDAEAILRGLTALARARGDEGLAYANEVRANLLAECRKRGARAVFAEISRATPTKEAASDPRALWNELKNLEREAESRPERFNFECQIQICNRLLEAIRHEEAPEFWVALQGNKGNALQGLGSLAGDPTALLSAEAAYKEALKEHTRERAPLPWAMTQNNLGAALFRLGVLTGDAAALLRAEAALNEALKEYTRERAPIDWAMTQNNLGNILQCLGELAGDASALRRAEAAFNDALQEYSRERAPMGWAMTQNNLGNVLVSFGRLAGDPLALLRAETAYNEALKERTRERAPMDWAMTQNNLGNLLFHLGDLVGDAAALMRAEAAYNEALKEFTRERASMQWAMAQNNLGNALFRLGFLAADAAALMRAEAAYNEALKEFTRERVLMQWAATQNNLGNVLRDLHILTGETAVWRRAEAAYREALDAYSASDERDVRQGVAGRLASLLIGGGCFVDAANVIVPAIALSELALIDSSRSLDGRTRSAEVVGDLHGLLSLCRLRQPERDVGAALVAAEAGRARLLASALGLNAIRLEEINEPGIRGQIEGAKAHRQALRRRLGFEASDGGTAAFGLSSADRERLQEELTDATEAYLALCREHGLIRMTEPPTLAEIRTAVPSGGALVLPVLTDREAFVFVLADAKGELAILDLPSLSRREVVEHLSGEDRWLDLYDGHFRNHQAEKPGAAQAWRGQLGATMAWLWERLMAPIHIHMRDAARLGRGAPVVLLAPGLLGILPLHAAGPGPDGRMFGDHWTVSYAPSARALAICRDRAEERSGLPPQLLAVLDPDGSLPGARAEEAMLRRRFEGVDAEPAILVGEDAVVTAVIARLPTATVFHASTHGHHHPILPIKSGLKMADGELTLEDLRHARLEAARLVFLSACESGLAGVRKLPEEFIGLPAGFVQAGAACVIGSLWPIRDDASFLLASRFYEEWLDEHGRERTQPAAALKAALVWLRNVTFAELKAIYDVAKTDQGFALVLRSARFWPASSESPPTPEPKPLIELRLPLGPDDARPFEHPEYWAAFACTGA